MPIGDRDDAIFSLEQQLNRLHRCIGHTIENYLKPIKGTRYKTVQEN